MSSQNQVIFLDDEVPTQLLSVIRNADKYAVIVTPYIKLWGHAKQAIEQAKRKGIQMTFLVRSDQQDDLERARDDLIWLQSNDVAVWGVERLHAKIYLNEKSVVISSMNLHQSSAQNSLEIAMVVQDQNSIRRIREYVEKSLKESSQPLSSAMAIGVSPRATTSPTKGYTRSSHGFCIRCHGSIELDPDKPLCPGCYEVWAEWGDGFYPEKHCHVCGKSARVSYARPLCNDCFHSV